MIMTLIMCRKDFYPRSPCGERQKPIAQTGLTKEFLSTLSLRRATGCHAKAGCKVLISIHALLAESDWHCLCNAVFLPISIHALLAESDRADFNAACASSISIHALLAESDAQAPRRKRFVLHFYPRSPCGERPKVGNLRHAVKNFYPRSPCGERLYKVTYSISF